MNKNKPYLIALRGAAAHGFEGGGGGRVENGGGAADAAGAWDPRGVIAGVDGHEQSLRRGPDLGAENVGRVLSGCSAGGYRRYSPAAAGGEEAGEVLEAAVVIGLHLEDGVLPWERSFGAEGGARAVYVDELECGALFRGKAVRVLEGMG